MVENFRIWVGSYTGGTPGKGIYALRFTGKELSVEQSWEGLTNPSYLQPAGDKIYAVEEQEGKGSVVALCPGKPGYQRYEVPGVGLCHITACGPFLYTSGYSGGSLTGLNKETGAVCCFLEHRGIGHDPIRQEKAHIHSAQPAWDGRHLFVADLGLDKLFQYEIGPKGELIPHTAQPWVQVKPGQGPRHFALHPNGEWLYLVTELDLSLLVYHYDRKASLLEYREEHSMKKGGSASGATAADIHISPDQRFVYTSVRGLDKIFCFRILEGGRRLEAAGDFPSCGRDPRSFHISPNGKYLAAANQTSGNVAVFALDQASGALGELLAEISVPQVSCVKWESL